ncbi:LuxR C-terminal-related transcriptional regulator [Serratia fonticola]|uniref:LuxR C-terminal-related transcriptional regulator n=1 Tax=Serratia fonticola TaxID=47917 RepID=UPI00192D172A|nr:LuxR C-terminal-related transcriptional regulator [Serratia fonticola]MBL5829226.1 LuxR family transcriptional regulator [Serratia fonticola]
MKIKHHMKKILLLCDCHFYRMALKYFFERQKNCEVEFIRLESLKGRTCSQDTVLIHLAEDNYSAILRIFENRHLCLFDNTIVITSKRLITHLRRFFDEQVKFIDELFIFNEPSYPEAFEQSIEARDNLCEIDLKTNLLSISEFLILSMLMTGLSPTTVALKTKKSIKTISAQKVNALRKLGLDNTPHSMLKIAHIFCFPAALRSTNR